jgi:sodium/potassium-transporting ATPase subunit alpha
VFQTGDKTFFGCIAKSTTTISRPKSLLHFEVLRLILIISYVIAVLGGVFFMTALFKGYTLIQSVVFLIGIVVATVPAGLLPQLTLALTITAKKMLSFGVLVNNLDTIETLGKSLKFE